MCSSLKCSNLKKGLTFVHIFYKTKKVWSSFKIIKKTLIFFLNNFLFLYKKVLNCEIIQIILLTKKCDLVQICLHFFRLKKS